MSRPKPSKEPTVEQAAKNFDMDLRLYKLWLEVRKVGDEISAEYQWKAIKVFDPLIMFEHTLFELNKELKRLKGTK